MQALISTGKQENRMTDGFDVTMAECARCGSHVWDDGQGNLRDVRALTNDPFSDRCPDGVAEHRAG